MLTRASLHFAVIVALASCSSSDDSSPSKDPNADVKAWLASFAAAQCAATAPCCQNAGLPHDDARCRASLETLGWQSAEHALQNGATFDADLAAQCLTAMQSMDCAAQSDLPRECDLAIRADTAAGSPCEETFECARPPEGSSRCAITGICLTEIPGGAVGSVCAGATRYECGPGLVCDDSDDTCHDGAGVSCSNDSDCALEDYCDTSAPDNNLWTCVPRAQVGEPCGANKCVSVAQCTSGSCQLKLPATAACTQSSDCQNGRCDNLNGRCKFFDWCTAP